MTAVSVVTRQITATIVQDGSIVATVMAQPIVTAQIAMHGVQGPPGTEEGGGAVAWADITDKPATFPPAAHSHAYATPAQGALADTAVQPAALTAKQDVLVAGTNIKTVNGTPLLGSGDLAITGASPLLGWFL